MKPGPFAKLYGEGEDQVLALLLENDEANPKGGMVIKFYFLSKATGAVCATAVGYDDSDDGYDTAHEMFAGLDEAQVRDAADKCERWAAEYLAFVAARRPAGTTEKGEG